MTLPKPTCETTPLGAIRLQRWAEQGWNTRAASSEYALGDRGLLRLGMVADVVLFDERITDNATFEAPTEMAAGIRAVFVAGQAVISDGRQTLIRPGGALVAT